MGMEFYRQELHRAKKAHKCEMCEQQILPGEQYSYESGMYEGDFFTRKMHSACYEKLSYMLSEMGEYEFDWDMLADWWKEHRCPVCAHYYLPCEPSDCIYYSESAPCEARSGNGRCTDGDTCNEMTRLCWCEKFELEKKAVKENNDESN